MVIDSVHFYVNDATNTSNWFINCLEFQLVDLYQDDDTLTIAIAKKAIFLVISSPLNNHSSVAHYLSKRAEGVVDITFKVEGLKILLDRVHNSGIKILQPIQQEGVIKYSCVGGWDSLRHTLIESIKSQTKFNCYLLPNGKLRKFLVKKQSLKQDSSNLIGIDHIVLNVARGKLESAVSFYQLLFGFKIQQTFKIKTTRSGLSSQALIDRQGQVQFNINEPTTTNSQIQKFIELNGGAGIQHIAFQSTNLIEDIARINANCQQNIRQQNKLRSRSNLLSTSSDRVAFLPIPLAYYQHLQQRLKQDLRQFSSQELQSIGRQKILIDWQNHYPQSLLLQIFTQPILQKPTFFLEFIERRQQAIGFGEGNFQALFAAVEQEQIRNQIAIDNQRDN
jgi:4-hydroxyphenylpyruvate dioxygenase